MENDHESSLATSAAEASPRPKHKLEELLNGISSAVHEFNSDATPENFAKIVNSIAACGISGAKVWKDANTYVKDHPVRVAFGVGLIFFALKGLLGSGEKAVAVRQTTYH